MVVPVGKTVGEAAPGPAANIVSDSAAPARHGRNSFEIIFPPPDPRRHLTAKLDAGKAPGEASAMAEPNDPLIRIAEALQRLAPERPAATDWLSAPAYLWSGRHGRSI